MRVDKVIQTKILKTINDFLAQRNVKTVAYLFGGNSLISQDIIGRSTKDLDLFMFLEQDEQSIVKGIKKVVVEKHSVDVDIGTNSSFTIPGKNFTWTLPKNAYTRAIPYVEFPNLKVFSLNPIDIIVLKCDRFNEQDQRDIINILIVTQPSKKFLLSIFNEYVELIKGNRASIEIITENFHTLVMVLHDIHVTE